MKKRSSVLALCLCVAGACAGVWASPTEAFAAYLPCYLFWLGIPLGVIGMREVQALSGGRWGEVLDSRFRLLSSALPSLLVLSLPIFWSFWRPVLPHAAESLPDSAALRSYLNPAGLTIRSVIMLAVWLVCSRKTIAGTGWWGGEGGAAAMLLAIVFSVTFAAIDWTMVLAHGWTSSIYGLIFVFGDGLAGYAVAAFLWNRCSTDADEAMRWTHAKMLATLIVLLLYASYSQYIIMWQGGIPRETSWYGARTVTAWKYLAAVVIACELALPLALLLFGGWRRGILNAAVGLILAGRMLDLIWTVLPSFSPERVFIPWALPFFFGAIGLLLALIWEPASSEGAT